MAKVVSNSGKKTLILHIGPGKTGSTTLQRYIFPNLEDVDYPEDFWKNIGKLDYKFASTDDFVELLKPYIENSQKSSMVFSREGLWEVGAQRLRKSTLDKMGCLVATVKVIVVIRRQGDILPSIYAQNPPNYRKAGFEDYVESIFNSNKLPAYINYESIVDSFINAFGNDAVHVTPMEALFDPANKDARHRLALFMGVKPKALEAAFNAAEPANKRASSNGQKVTYEVKSRLTYSGRAMQSAWHKTKYFLGPIRNKSWFKSLRQRFRHRLTRPIQDFQVTQERKAELTAAFAESNWRLAKKCGLEQELQRYGYFPNPTNGDTEEKIEAD
ncbi:MAG: hypothetical protein BRC40_08305 [Cyanobacteria bacterium QH_8_48_120]|nr:MAG: hypothetical protein BRC40_08305 [Cyanobacteria bacterium QH_8_48_120]